MKILEDTKNYFVIQAPNGAKVKVAKSGLSSPTSQKIQQMAQGGKVEYAVSEENTIEPKAAEAFRKALSGAKEEKPKPKEEPKKVAKYADGGLVQEEPGTKPIDININVSGQQQPQEPQREPDSMGAGWLPKAVGSGIMNVVSGIANNPVGKALLTGDPSHLNPPQATPAVAQEGAQPAIGQAPAQNPLQAPLQAGGGQPQAQPISAIDVQRLSMQPTAGEAQSMANYQNITGQEVAAIDRGQRESEQAFEKGYGESSEFVQKINQHEQNYNQISQELEGLQKKVQNFEIKPQTMFSGGNFLQNIGTALSVLAGGISQGLTGAKSNPVLDYINNQIDLDVQRQKQEFGKLENQYTIMRQRGIHEAEAINLIKAQQYATITAQLRQKEMQTKNTLTKLELQKAQQSMMLQAQGFAKQAAIEKSLRSGVAEGQIDPAVYVETQLPKEERKAAREDLHTVQNFNSAYQSVNSLFDEAKNISGIEANLPFGTKKKRLEAIGSRIAAIVRSSFKGQGTLSDQEDKTLIQPNLPGRFDTAAQIDEARQGVLGLMHDKYQGSAQVLKGYGIPIPQPTAVKSLGGYTKVGAKK